MSKSQQLSILVWLGIIATVCFLYRPSFSSFFFQDDWFSFSISNASSLKEVARFFIPRSDVIYYRPLGMQVPFYLVNTIVGLQPLLFRIATLMVHILNSFILYKIFIRTLKSRTWSLLGTFLYATSTVHFTPFYWAATFAFVMIPGFYFGAILAFLVKKYRLAFGIFILGMFVNELIITLPLLLLGVNFITKDKPAARQLAAFLGMSFLYVSMRLMFRIPTEGNYSLAFSVRSIMTTIRDYGLWTFHFPEEIHNQFVSFFMLNPVFLKDFLNRIWWWSTNMTIVMIVLIASWIIAFKHRKKAELDLMKLGCVWYILSLLPVFFFRDHAFSYYLPIALGGLMLTLMMGLKVLSEILKKNQPVIVAVSLLLPVVWGVSSYQTLIFNKDVHWAPRRAKIAREITKNMTSRHPNIEEDGVIVIENRDENKWALGDQDAFKVIYHHPTILTWYGTHKEYLASPHFKLDPTRPVYE